MHQGIERGLVEEERVPEREDVPGDQRSPDVVGLRSVPSTGAPWGRAGVARMRLGVGGNQHKGERVSGWLFIAGHRCTMRSCTDKAVAIPRGHEGFWGCV